MVDNNYAKGREPRRGEASQPAKSAILGALLCGSLLDLPTGNAANLMFDKFLSCHFPYRSVFLNL